MRVLVVGVAANVVTWLQKRFSVLHVDNADIVLKNRYLLTDIDAIVYTGGSDIPPEYYNQQKHHKTYNSASGIREEKEFELFYDQIAYDMPFIGICRGAQFLAVMNGADMYQHVTGHQSGKHKIKYMDGVQEREMEVTSTHHQMVDITPVMREQDFELIGWSEGLCTEAIKMPDAKSKHTDEVKCVVTKEPEIFKFHGLNTLCIQGHPEYGTASEQFSEFCLDLVEETIEEAACAD